MIGSLGFFFGPAEKAYKHIQSLYLDFYGYRKNVSLVATDIAKLAEEQEAPLISAYLVLNDQFQVGELPFIRYINRVEKLNICRKGEIIQKMDAMEMNYFRIHPGVVLQKSQWQIRGFLP
jgi:hypothetical protein